MILAAIGIVAGGLAMVVSPAFAVPDAKALIQALGEDGTKTLADANLSPADREREFRRLLQTNFDIDGMAKLAIGRYGKQLTADQWQTYRALFEEFIVKVYSQHLGQHTWDRFVVTEARQADDGGNLVTSETTLQGQPPTQIIWHVHDTGQGLKVIDVSVAGISMVVTQRQEFAAVIQNGAGGIDGFLAMLRRKTSELP